MDTLLIIILIAVVLALVVNALRPAPPQIVYVPIETPAQDGGMGCLPLIMLGILVFVALRFIVA